jgi:hypothetical protein
LSSLWPVLGLVREYSAGENIQVFTEGRADSKWRRARASIPFNDCVEVLINQESVRVRDSKGGQVTELRFEPRVWACFVSDVHSR